MGRTGNKNRKQGTYYELQAAAYLEQKGYRILEHGFCSRFGEIDLIARKDGCLIFVEVKYRAQETGGHPLEAVGRQKQRRLCRTAAYYCLKHGYWEDMPSRFDVVGILGKDIYHVEDAFPYCE